MQKHCCQAEVHDRQMGQPVLVRSGVVHGETGFQIRFITPRTFDTLATSQNQSEIALGLFFQFADLFQINNG